jgi:hemerythrin-like domain-containing protein
MIQIGVSPATIDSPIEHLAACHRRIEQRLDTLVNAADHIKHDPSAAAAAIAASLRFLDTSGVLHTRDEEDSLFPRLRPKLTPTEAAFLDTLESQHAEAECIYLQLKSLQASLNDPAFDAAIYKDCAVRLREFYKGHIQSEDQILAVLATRLLDQTDLRAITQEMHYRRTVKR